MIELAERSKPLQQQFHSGLNAYEHEGVSELLVELSEIDIGVCVVTLSPQSYCSRVLRHFHWKDIKMVCYHDTRRHNLVRTHSCVDFSYLEFRINKQFQSATIRLIRRRRQKRRHFLRWRSLGSPQPRCPDRLAAGRVV